MLASPRGFDAVLAPSFRTDTKGLADTPQNLSLVVNMGIIAKTPPVPTDAYIGEDFYFTCCLALHKSHLTTSASLDEVRIRVDVSKLSA